MTNERGSYNRRYKIILEITERDSSPSLGVGYCRLSVSCHGLRAIQDDLPWHRSSMIISDMTFDLPYGLSAFNRVVSGIGMVGGVP
jgi:hypothetical protein